MNTTWILSAHRAGAKLYERRPNGAFRLVREIAHPEGRLQSHEMGTDRPGTTGEPGGVQRNAYGTDRDPAEETALAFARALAAELTRARNEHACESFVLLAPPQFLGTLRKELDAPTAAMVTHSAPLDLAHATEDEVKKHVEDVLKS